MTRTPLVALGLSLAGAEMARAQIIEGGGIGRARGEPIAWTSLSIGWLSHQGQLCDDGTGSCWNFGSAPQWRGTLEYPMGTGATIGVAATAARAPLIYGGGSCPQACDADANVTQYFANLRIGGGLGFHQVIDLNAGITVFSNFRRTTGERLLPEKAVTDFTFAVGYGFGYSVSQRVQIMLVQDFGLVIHKRQTGTANRTMQQSTLRVGGRVSLGEKSR